MGTTPANTAGRRSSGRRLQRFKANAELGQASNDEGADLDFIAQQWMGPEPGLGHDALAVAVNGRRQRRQAVDAMANLRQRFEPAAVTNIMLAQYPVPEIAARFAQLRWFCCAS